MKKIYLPFSLVLFSFLLAASCTEKSESQLVTYEVTTNNEDFEISYKDENGIEIHRTIRESDWTTSFSGKRGDSVSISIAANKLNDKIVAKILYDGMVLKEVVTYGQLSDELAKASISTILPF